MDKGTQLICISPNNGLVKGNTYTVVDSVIAFGIEYVQLEGIENLVRANRFDLSNICRMVRIQCPKNFIRFNSNENKYKTEITVDSCLKDEIIFLWSMGVKTAGCCCGHGIKNGFINVFDESIGMMYKLGYELYDWEYAYKDSAERPEFSYERYDTFKPKSKCLKSMKENE